jgi:enoyl-CoA hydratase/carnithine racemase
MDRLQQLKNEITKGLKKIKLEFEDEGRIAVIYLNAPKELNALSSTMRSEICGLVLVLDKDPTVKVILFMSCVDRAFCAGADVTEFPSLTYES